GCLSEKLARPSRSPTVSSSSRGWCAASRSASRWIRQCGLAASRAPTIRSASGRYPHEAAICAAAAGSAATRCGPAILPSSSTACPAGRTPRSITSAKVSPASPARLLTSPPFPAPAAPGGPPPRRPAPRGQRRAAPPLVAPFAQPPHPPPVGQQRPVQPGPGVHVLREALALHPQRTQEPAQHLRWRQGLRLGAAQVHVQLPIREQGAKLVAGVHRQRRLAHPRLPHRAGDHHRRRLAPAGHPGPQPFQRALPAGEILEVGRQLGQRHGHPRRPTVTRPTVARPTVARPTVARPTVARPTVARPTVARP